MGEFSTNLREQRIGLIGKSVNDEQMEIVEYRSNKDIDVRFENGYIAEHVNYGAFCKGLVKNRWKHVGEIRTMKNGMKATVISARMCDDIDIEFEDGYIVRHQSYSHFCKGEIANWNNRQKPKNKEEKLGEVKYNKYGEKMTLIEYINCDDVVVQFENGETKHVRYGKFNKGVVRSPSGSKYHRMSFPELVFLYYLEPFGFEKRTPTFFFSLPIPFPAGAEIDLYNDEMKIGIEYDGSYYHSGKKRRAKDLAKDRYAAENGITMIRIREEPLSLLNDGSYEIGFKADNYSNLQSVFDFIAKVIYEVCDKEITVDANYQRDADIIKSKYQAMYNKRYQHRVDEKYKMHNGQEATVVKIVDDTNVDIEFEDGTIKKNVQYASLRTGHIRNPNVRNIDKNKMKERLGETSLSSTGEPIKIIEYNDAQDITVQFEDGTVKEHCSYQAFRIQGICKPDTNKILLKNKRAREGEISYTSRGEKMTLIEYINTNDVTVQFEDGLIVKHKTYCSFQHGTIGRADSKPR